MRKSSLIALFLLQLMALFIFENIYSLMKGMEKKAVDEIIHQAESMARFGVLAYQQNPRSITGLPFFYSTTTIPQKASGTEIIQGKEENTLVIKKPINENLSLVFSKSLRTPLVDSIVTLKRILFWLNLILAIFLTLTGFYFIYRLKKDRVEETADGMPPLQSYLLELKNAQQELQQFLKEQHQQAKKKEELNINIIANLHLAVILINPTGQIEIFNPAAEAIFSRSFSLAKNSSVDDVLSDYPELFRFISQTDEKKSTEIESAQKAFYIDLIPIPNMGKLVLLRDITEEKKRERIQQINASLLILGEMTASLAHEIKNSLGIIFGYTRMLEGEKEKTSKIIDEILFLMQMMENFLSFAKPVDNLNWQTCDVKEMLIQLGETNGITIRLPKKEMIITSDPILLNRIFSNLLLNSRQAGAGIVTIDFKINDATEIRISDDGGGIANKNQDKIWLPFFSTKEKGTGMGLPLVKKMVNALNGDIQLVRSGKDGTAFLISFYPR